MNKDREVGVGGATGEFSRPCQFPLGLLRAYYAPRAVTEAGDTQYKIQACRIYILLDLRSTPTVPATEGAGNDSEWLDRQQPAFLSLSGPMKLLPRQGY